MSETQNRSCKSCSGAMHEIQLLASTAGGQRDVEYALLDAHRSLWTGRFEGSGKVDAFICESCGQIALYGKPQPGK